MTMPNRNRHRLRCEHGHTTQYRPGTFVPAHDPLHGLNPDQIAELKALGEARDALDARSTERLFTSQAACTPTAIGIDLWFPTDRSYAKGGKQVCEVCPVQRPCLLYALATDQRHGLWGGATAEERIKLRTQIRAAKATVVTDDQGGDHD